jgi:hypothetical protein
MARWETVTDVLDHPLDPLDVEPPGPPGEGWPPEAHEVSTSSRWPTARRRRNFSHWEWAERIATIVVVAGCVLYTLAQLHPDLILKNTTPAGGDMGAHVWGPAYLRDHILPHFWLSGWSPDWYAGFPMYVFYMVPPALAVVVLDIVVPYGVALKLISILGILAMPACAYAFGKLAGLKFPVPPLFAVAATFFLFDETFQIYGGNIASTMAGEFSFSIALSLALLFLGVFAYGLRTGKHRALAAGLFALTALCHVIVMFFAVIGAVVLFLLWADKKRLKYIAGVGIVGGLLCAFWYIPFWRNSPYMTDMFYERLDQYWAMLFPQSTMWSRVIFVLAVVGLVGAVVRGLRAGAFLGIMCIGYAVWACLWPQSHLWNARLLPFYYLTRDLLVAMGVAEIGLQIARFVRPGDARTRQWFRFGTLGFAVIAGLIALGLHLQNLPFFTQRWNGSEWVYEAGPISVKSQPAYVDDWAKWNYSGYEGKDAYGEYSGVVNTMKQVGQQNGCGRALWENNNAEDRYGTPMALMLLPFWTDGCIGSMEGLYFEASGTTPYHFLTTSAMSEHSSNPVRRLKYEDGDVDKGVQYMQTLGVRYYLAFSQSVIAKADKNPALTPIAQSGPWKVYEVADSDMVVPLTTEPVVATGADKNRDTWLELGTSYFQDESAWPGVPAASGPADWQRVTLTRTGVTNDRTLATVSPSAPVPAATLPAVTVSDVKTGDNSISFKVDQIGVPVLVKASYFPNWKVSGAKGPYRVAPNQMVVIPTSNQVSLHYGHTGVEYLSYLLSLVGIAGLVYLWRKGRIDYGPRLDPAPALSAPPGLDDVSDWTLPEPAEAITFLIDWDEDDIEPAPEPDTNLPPPDVGEQEPEDQMSRPPPG